MKTILLLAVLCIALNGYAADKVDFVLYAQEKCVPCEMLKASLEALKIKVVEGVKNENDKVWAYPTLVVVVNGIEKYRIEGYVQREKLQERLAPYTSTDTCKPAEVPVKCKTN